MYNNKRIGLIVPAAGCGSRMGTDLKKQYLTIKGKEILERTITSLLSETIYECVCITAPMEDIDELSKKIELWTSELSILPIIKIIAGGATRQDSVFNALKQIEGLCDFVVVHDGVRPFVPKDWVRRHIDQLYSFKGLSAGFKVIDTMKKVNSEQLVLETLNREEIWGIQTPQMFNYDILYEAHQRAFKEHFVGTDDMSLLERMGEKVIVFPCEQYNIKITTPYDLVVGEAIAHWLEAEEGKA